MYIYFAHNRAIRPCLAQSKLYASDTVFYIAHVHRTNISINSGCRERGPHIDWDMEFPQ